MKRIRVAAVMVILCLGLLSSCATLFPSVQETPVTTNRDRVGAAITLLGSDIVKSLNETSIEAKDLYTILPTSFCAYQNYVPAYQTLRDQYLWEIGNPGYQELLANVNLVMEDISKLSKNPMPYVSGDSSLTARLRQDLYETFYRKLISIFEESALQLNAAFDVPRKTFLDIRKAYANLSNVGIVYDLPVPESVNVSQLAKALTNKFFENMEWYEKLLKNTPAEAGSLYTVFWED